MVLQNVERRGWESPLSLWMWTSLPLKAIVLPSEVSRDRRRDLWSMEPREFSSRGMALTSLFCKGSAQLLGHKSRASSSLSSFQERETTKGSFLVVRYYVIQFRLFHNLTSYLDTLSCSTSISGTDSRTPLALGTLSRFRERLCMRNERRRLNNVLDTSSRLAHSFCWRGCSHFSESTPFGTPSFMYFTPAGAMQVRHHFSFHSLIISFDSNPHCLQIRWST